MLVNLINVSPLKPSYLRCLIFVLQYSPFPVSLYCTTHMHFCWSFGFGFGFISASKPYALNIIHGRRLFWIQMKFIWFLREVLEKIQAWKICNLMLSNFKETFSPESTQFPVEMHENTAKKCEWQQYFPDSVLFIYLAFWNYSFMHYFQATLNLF